MSAATWLLDGTTARLSGATVEASIDLSQPQLGLSLRIPHTRPLAPPLRVLGIAFCDQFSGVEPLPTHSLTFGDRPRRDLSAVDIYVRQADLVVIYDSGAMYPMRAQAYWRRLPPEEFAHEYA